MQDPKYAGKYSVEQQLALLSKWLAESGFGEAAMLVSAAAISVQDATAQRRLARPPAGTAPAGTGLAAAHPLAKTPRDVPPPAELHDKRRARSA